MSDASWLRLLGGPRSRTPVSNTSPSSEPAIPTSEQHPQHAGQSSSTAPTTAASENPSQPQRRLHTAQSKSSLSRLPSWPALSQAGAAAATANAELPDLFVREADRVIEQPSIDQIADCLLATVMAKSTLDPLGPEHCSSILHLIEAYGANKRKLKEIESRLSEAAERYRKETDEFENQVSEWTIQEARYKAEIKRLEIILHRTSANGLEAVTLARSESLVDRNPRSRFQLKLDEDTGPDTTDGAAEDQRDEKFNQRASYHIDMVSRNRNSILGRPRILDPKSDVKLSKQMEEGGGLIESGTSIIQGGQLRRLDFQSNASEAHPTVSLVEGSSSGSSGEEAAQVQPRKAPERRHIPGRQQFHRREFSFVPGKDSVEAEPEKGLDEDKSPKNTTEMSPQLQAGDTSESLRLKYHGIEFPAQASKPGEGVEKEPSKLDTLTEKEFDKTDDEDGDVSDAKSTSTVKYLPGEC